MCYVTQDCCPEVIINAVGSRGDTWPMALHAQELAQHKRTLLICSSSVTLPDECCDLLIAKIPYNYKAFLDLLPRIVANSSEIMTEMTLTCAKIVWLMEKVNFKGV